MSTNQAVFPISIMARVLGVSTAGYYAWRERPPSAHAQADAALLKRLRTVHASSRHIYGAPRVHPSSGIPTASPLEPWPASPNFELKEPSMVASGLPV